MPVPSFERRADTGLMMLRLGLGAMFIAHGVPKIIGGPEKWEVVGSAMSNFGIHSLHWLWGLLAGITESLGGVFLILGLYTSLWCFLLTITMIVAAAFHFNNKDSFALLSHPVELGIVFLCLILIGPGRFSIDGLQHRLALKRKLAETQDDNEPPPDDDSGAEELDVEIHQGFDSPEDIDEEPDQEDDVPWVLGDEEETEEIKK